MWTLINGSTKRAQIRAQGCRTTKFCTVAALGPECGTACHPSGALNFEVAPGIWRIYVSCVYTILKCTCFKNRFYLIKRTDHLPPSGTEVMMSGAIPPFFHILSWQAQG
jgi:hypothetical protein